MSVIVIETTITRAYLRNKTKDEIIEHVMRLLDENDALAAQVDSFKKIYGDRLVTDASKS
jgi:hypothetical protein